MTKTIGKLQKVSSVPVTLSTSLVEKSRRSSSFQQSGTVDSIYVSIGDSVLLGDTLITLKANSRDAAISLQRVKLAGVNDQYKRINALFEKGIKTAVQRDKAKREYRMEKARLTSLLQNKGSTILISEHNGIISDLMTSSEENITSGEPVLSIFSGVYQFELSRNAITSKLDETIEYTITNHFLFDSTFTFTSKINSHNNKFYSTFEIDQTQIRNPQKKSLLTFNAPHSSTYTLAQATSSPSLTQGTFIELLLSDNSTLLGEIIYTTSSSLYITISSEKISTDEVSSISPILL